MAIDGGIWAWMGPKCKTIEGLHIERVENSVGPGGTPDVDGCFKGSGFKLELKHAHEKKTSDHVDISFRKGQPGWLKKRWAVGGNAWVLLKTGMGATMKLYLIRGCDLGHMSPVGDDKLVWKTNARFLSDISVISHDATVEDIIKTAAGFSF